MNPLLRETRLGEGEMSRIIQLMDLGYRSLKASAAVREGPYSSGVDFGEILVV